MCVCIPNQYLTIKRKQFASMNSCGQTFHILNRIKLRMANVANESNILKKEHTNFISISVYEITVSCAKPVSTGIELVQIINSIRIDDRGKHFDY